MLAGEHVLEVGDQLPTAGSDLTGSVGRGPHDGARPKGVGAGADFKGREARRRAASRCAPDDQLPC
jgi:hypothetical protein